MNNNIWKYIVQNTNQDFIYDSTIEKEEPIDNSDDVLIDQMKENGEIYL